MSKIYFVTYDGLHPDREALLKWLDTQPAVLDWQATAISPLLVVVWNGTAGELIELLRNEAGMDQFVVAAAKISDDGQIEGVNGYLAKATIEFVRRNSARRPETRALAG